MLLRELQRQVLRFLFPSSILTQPEPDLLCVVDAVLLMLLYCYFILQSLCVS